MKFFSSIFFITVLLFINSLSTANGQIPTVLWSKCYGGFGIENGYSIVNSYEGGYILVGRTDDESGQVTGYHPGNCTGWPCSDAWIVHIDSIGDLLWQGCLGGTNEDMLYDIALSSDSVYVISGNTSSNDGDVSGNHGNSDVWLVKINRNGNVVWQKCFGGTENEFSGSVSATSDSGFIIGGSTLSNDGDVSGNHAVGTYDVWVVKTDSIGNVLWQKCLGGSQNDAGNEIAISENNYFVYASSYSNDGDVTFNHSTQQDIWLVKLDSLGSIIWQKSYGGSAGDNARSGLLTTDSGFIFLGSTMSSDGDIIGAHGYYDFWIVKIDSLGSLQWQRPSGGSMIEDALDIIQSSDGGYLAVGGTISNDGDVSGNHGDEDGWIIKLDSLGQLEWQKCIGGSGGELFNALLESSNGEIFALGVSQSIDGDLIGANNHGAGDMWLVKLSSPYVGIFAPENPLTDFKASFNSATENLYFSLYANGYENPEIQLFDITGRRLFNKSISLNEGFNEQNIRIELLGSGIYILSLIYHGISINKKIFISY